MKFLYLKIVLFVFSLVFFVNNSYSQTRLLLKDKVTSLPVTGASYLSANQKGESDENGYITLIDQHSLSITHISYLPVQLNHNELATAIKEGMIFLLPSDQTLNPVTVYAVKGKSDPNNLKLNNGDWVQHDAGQVLQQIPGFSSIKKSGGFGFDPVFRGFKLDQLNILTNGGLTSLAACPSRMDPPTSQVLISQVEKIEIQKGPHSFRYGPAFGAVINFKTAEPEFSEQVKPFGRVNAGYESNGEIYRTEGMIGAKTKKAQIAATGSYSKGHDYRDGNDSIIPAGFGRGSIGLQADFRVKEANLASFSATRSFARNTNFPTLMMDLLKDDSWMLQGQYKANASGKWYTHWHSQLYASFVDHLMGNNLRPAMGKMSNPETDANTKVFGGRTELAITSAKSELFVGLDAKHEDEDGYRKREMIAGPMAGRTFIDTIWQDSRISRGGVFSEWHYALDGFKLAVSGRLDVVHANALNPNSKFKAQYETVESTDVNPSLSIGISRQWTDNWFTGLWLGRGVRSAGIPERYINYLQIGIDNYDMLGNPEIKPEANQQTDLIVAYKSAKTFIQLNGFGSIVSDYISAVVDPSLKEVSNGAPGVRRYINIDRALLAGFEFSWNQLFIPQLQQQFNVSYTYGKNDVTGKPLPQISPMDFRYLLEGRFIENKLMPYVQLRHVLKQERVADDYKESRTPEFTTVNLGIKTEPVKNLMVTAALNNLFDRAYREHLSRFIRPTLALNAPGRSFVIMASYSF